MRVWKARVFKHADGTMSAMVQDETNGVQRVLASRVSRDKLRQAIQAAFVSGPSPTASKV